MDKYEWVTKRQYTGRIVGAVAFTINEVLLLKSFKKTVWWKDFVKGVGTGVLSSLTGIGTDVMLQSMMEEAHDRKTKQLK